MSRDSPSVLKRLTPAILADQLHRKLRRSWMSLLSVVSGFPLIGRLIHRIFLVDQVSLTIPGSTSAPGYSLKDMESVRQPIYLTAERYGEVIDACRAYLHDDPYGFATFPDIDQNGLNEGGMGAVDHPVRGIVYQPPRRFRCTVRDAWLDLDSGGVCTSEMDMVTEVAPRNRRGSRLQKMWFYGKRKPSRATNLDERCVTVWCKWAGRNYYHWLIEGLPRIARISALAQQNPLTLLVPEFMPQAWEESLECFLPLEGLKVRRLEGWVRMREFEFLSIGLVHPVAWLAQDERDCLRNTVFQKLGLGGISGRGKRLYLSRAAATVRRLSNEAEIAEILKERGFEIVQPEKLSFADQVRLFNSADFVVSIHGAGLSNLVWSGRVKVLELFPSGKFKPLYFFLAASLGQDYQFLTGGAPSRLEDFYIDPGKLAQKIDPMLTSRSF